MGYLPIGGGALNASFTDVDAVANICSMMGNAGYVYGRDYYWAYNGYDDDMDDAITLFVKDEKMKTEERLKEMNKDLSHLISAACQIKADYDKVIEEKGKLEQACEEVQRKMEFNCVSCDEKIHFFYNMTQNLKKHIKAKEAEKKKQKKLAIDKLGKQKRKCYQQ